MKRRSSSILLTILLCNSLVLTSQSNLKAGIEKNLVKPLVDKSDELPTESIYLQTDKDIYETEEDIRFSATILNSQTIEHKASSKIYYFNLLDENKNTIYSEKYPVENGSVNGHFYLSDTLSPGNYILFGYTKNSINSLIRNYKTNKPIKIKKTIIPKILANYDLEKISNEVFNLKLKVLRRSGIESGIIKLKLKAFNGSRNVVLEKSETDSLGNVIIKFKLNEDKSYSNFIIEARTDDKIVESIPLNLDYKNEILDVLFFPEGGNLLANVYQKVGLRIESSSFYIEPYTCLIYENQNVIDTVKTNKDGLGQFHLIPKFGKNYKLKILKTNQEFSLPSYQRNGYAIHFLNELKDRYKFNIISNKDLIANETIYIRVQSKGIIRWLIEGALKDEKTIFYIPKNKLDSEITEVSVYNGDFEPLTSRLFYPNFENRIKIKLLDDVDRTYPTKSNIKLKVQLLDKDNNPIKGKVNVRIYDKLFKSSIYNQTMESFFKIEDELVSINNYAQNYLNSKSDMDLFLLSTSVIDYKWHPKLEQNQKNEFSIKEELYCKVLLKEKNGKLSNVGKVGINILSAQGLFRSETDSTGNFIIDDIFLKQVRGEQIFIKTQDENMVIKVLNKNDQEFTNSLLPKIRTILTDIEIADDSTQLKKKIQSYSFNSMNFLDEVVIDGKAGRKPKYLSSELTYLGYEGDYVCQEADVLNCENHGFGYKPIPYEYYYVKENTMSYVKKQYIPTGLTKENDDPFELKNYIIINSFYPYKEFESPIYTGKNENWEPDYRKTLLWKTNIQTDDNGIITLDYSTSDIRGEFICEIDAFTSNKGVFGYNSFGFFVY